MDLLGSILMSVPFLLGAGVLLASVIQAELHDFRARKAARRPVSLTPREVTPPPMTKAERHKEQQRLWDMAFEATDRLTKL